MLGVIRFLLGALEPEGAVLNVPRDAVVALTSHLDHIGKLEIRTRIADVAWLHGRACSHEVAAQCARDYLLLAQQTFDPVEWVLSFTYLRRAVRLSASLGRNHPVLADVSDGALSMLRAAAPSEPKYFSRSAIDLLLEYRIGDAAELATIAEQVAANAEPRDPPRARDYLHRAADCWKRSEQPARADDALRQIGQSLEREAMMFAVADQGAMHAAMLLDEAVSVYRSYAGGRPEVERVKPELQRQRARAAAALPRMELGTVDLSSSAERARESVHGKLLWDALVAFVTLGHPIPIERLRRSAKRRAEIAPLSTMMELVLLSPSGQVVNKQPGSSDPENQAGQLGRMHEDIVLYHRLLVIGGVVPALEQFQLEHGLAERDLTYLAFRSAFVPRGREPAFGAGLAAGLRNEFFVAAHILIPQFEHALRVQLNAIGVQTLTLPSSGIQDERDLGALLDMPELGGLYGEATVLDWKSLLTEKAGTNLRNELAHGLIEPGSRDVECAYLWWTVLRCVVAPLVNAAPAPPISQEATRETEGAEPDEPASQS